MGSRDYRHRETRKPPKGRRTPKVEALVPSPDTEVVKKRRIKKEEEA